MPGTEQEIITVYKSQVEGYVNGINQILAKVTKLEQEEKTQAVLATQNTNTLKGAAQARARLLDDEIANLKRLQQASKSAFTIPEIQKFNDQIATSHKNIDILKGKTDELGKGTSGLQDQFNRLGQQVIAAFAVERLIAFGEKTVQVAAAAGVATTGLAFAVTKVLGGTTEQVKELIDQSKQLSGPGVTFFSTRQIQQVQTMLADIGAAPELIKKLTPEILNLSTLPVFGNDTVAAADAVIQAVNGRGVALHKVGVELEKNGNLTEKLNDATVKLAKFDNAATDALNTTAGALLDADKRAEELEITIGNRLAPLFVTLKGSALAAADAITNFLFPPSQEERIKSLADSINGTLSSHPTQDLDQQKIKTQEKINALLKEADQLTGQDQLNSNDQASFAAIKLADVNRQLERQQGILKGINDVLNQRKQKQADDLKNAEIEGIKKEDLSKLSVDGLNKEIEALKARGDAADTRIKDEVTRREKAIEEIDKAEKKSAEELLHSKEENSKKLAELAIKSQDDLEKAQAGKDPIKLLDAEYDAKLKDAVRTFDLSKKSDDDIANLHKTLSNTEINYEKQISDATIKLREDTAKANIKNLQEDFAATKDTLELKRQEELHAANQTFISGDKSPASVAKLRNSITTINSNYDNVELTEAIKHDQDLIALGLGTDKDVLEAKKRLNENLLKEDQNLISAEEKLQHQREQALQKEVEIRKEIASAITDIVQQGISDVQQAQDQDFQNQIDAQTALNDANLQSIQDRIDANANAESMGTVSKREANEINKKLLAEKTAAEKKAAADISKIKIQQAEFDKLFQILQIGINTSQAVAKITAAVAVLTAESALNPFLVPLIALASSQIPIVIAEGILQAGFVAASPLPKFEFGTRHKGFSGLSIVGERGAELVNLPEGSQVLSSPRVNKNKDFINAMIDDDLQNFINRKYIAPALEAQKRKFEMDKEKSFAENIVNSITVSGGFDQWELRRALQAGTRINNVKEIAQAIANNSNKRYSAQQP